MVNFILGEFYLNLWKIKTKKNLPSPLIGTNFSHFLSFLLYLQFSQGVSTLTISVFSPAKPMPLYSNPVIATNACCSLP
jgi:hypothetical protein